MHSGGKTSTAPQSWGVTFKRTFHNFYSRSVSPAEIIMQVEIPPSNGTPTAVPSANPISSLRSPTSIRIWPWDSPRASWSGYINHRTAGRFIAISFFAPLDPIYNRTVNVRFGVTRTRETPSFRSEVVVLSFQQARSPERCWDARSFTPEIRRKRGGPTGPDPIVLTAEEKRYPE